MTQYPRIKAIPFCMKMGEEDDIFLGFILDDGSKIDTSVSRIINLKKSMENNSWDKFV